MQRIVVTGASGFVGATLVTLLRSLGDEVVPVSRRARPGFHHVDDYTQAPEGDIVVHLAEEADRARANRLGEAYGDETARVVTALARKAGHLVYGSSGVVYGDQAERPFPSDAPVQATDLYSAAKIRNEQIALAAGGTVARLSNLYGPGMSVGNVLSDIARQVPGAGALQVRDTGPVRDFLPAAEAASALAAAAVRRPGGILNVGSGVGVSIGELARLALAAHGQGWRAVVATQPAARRSVNVLDIAATTRQLGWRPARPPHADLERFFLSGAGT